MTYKATGASNPNIRNVNHITYLQRPNSGFVTAIVNKHQLVGHYPTQADAEAAVAGILIKLGCKDTATRMAAISTITTNLTPPVVDITPTAGSWADINHAFEVDMTVFPITETHSFGSAQLQITGIDTDVSFKINLSNTNVNLYYRKSATTILPGVTLDPSTLGSGFTRIVSGEQIVVSPNEYIRFKIKGSGTTNVTTTATVENTSNSTIYDTFLMSYTYTEVT